MRILEASEKHAIWRKSTMSRILEASEKHAIWRKSTMRQKSYSREGNVGNGGATRLVDGKRKI